MASTEQLDTGRWPAPPEISPRAAALARRFLSPLERYLHVEATSGVLLLFAAAAALFVANSPWSEAYHHALEARLGFTAGPFGYSETVHFWVNDILMTVFFFNVGLEIRHELHDGELSSLRKASLPLAAALGGMIVPASLYALVTAGELPEVRRAWGMPMATDIAFALGILSLLGRRVPGTLRVLLLAVAILDDIGSVLVIALVYSGGLTVSGLAIAAGGVLLTVLLQRFGVRRALAYVPGGIIVWAGIYRAGVHPTVAGVVLGLLTPATAWFGPSGLAHAARTTAQALGGALAAGPKDGASPEGAPVDKARLVAEARRLDRARREALAPAVRLQLLLHPWVAFFIMPVFALANAGVSLAGEGVAVTSLGIAVGVGLLVGKPLGVVGCALAAVRSGFASLPPGLGLRHLVVLGLVAGIGFTMALFMATLALPEGSLLAEAKVAILASSAAATILGLTAGLVLLPSAARVPPQTAASAA